MLKILFSIVLFFTYEYTFHCIDIVDKGITPASLLISLSINDIEAVGITSGSVAQIKQMYAIHSHYTGFISFHALNYIIIVYLVYISDATIIVIGDIS